MAATELSFIAKKIFSSVKVNVEVGTMNTATSQIPYPSAAIGLLNELQFAFYFLDFLFNNCSNNPLIF
jgi:hypothetical protein